MFHVALLARETNGENQLLFIKAHFGLAVPLFFGVSAFSLMYSTRIYSDRPNWIKTFLTKRFFRIAPLFYIMLALSILLKFNGPMTDRYEIFLNILFGYNLVPGYEGSLVPAGWTLGVEMIFYVTFPIIFILVTRLRTAIIFGLLTTLFSAAAVVAYDEEAQILAGMPPNWSLASNLCYFGIGVLAYFIWRALEGTEYRLIGGITLACLMAVVIAGLSTQPFLPAQKILNTLTVGLAVVGAAWLPIWPLSSRIASFIGERSFSIYLLHPLAIRYLHPLYRFFADQLPSQWIYAVAVLATMLIVIAAATVTYAFIERPGMALGEILNRRRLIGSPTAPLPRSQLELSKTS
jgi:peptidoglycan/LPS O-acetylase OafA/YrhL